MRRTLNRRQIPTIPPPHQAHSLTPSNQPLTSAPDSTSQIFTVVSSDPLATRFPSADIATEFTMPECPASVRTCQPAPASLSVHNKSLSETSNPLALSNGVDGAGGYKLVVPGLMGLAPGGGRAMPW